MLETLLIGGFEFFLGIDWHWSLVSTFDFSVEIQNIMLVC